MKIRPCFRILSVIFCFLAGCITEEEKTENIVTDLISRKEKEIHDYDRQEALAFWKASFSGEEKDFKKIADVTSDYLRKDNSNKRTLAVNELDITKSVLFEKGNLAFIEKLRASGLVRDSSLKRQLDILYLRVSKDLSDQQQNDDLIQSCYGLLHKIENERIFIRGKGYDKTEIDSIRKASSDPSLYKEIYEEKRRFVKDNYQDILKVVKLRNKYAQDCGYDNFYNFSLAIQEQSPVRLERLLMQVDSVTEKAYRRLKPKIDRFIALRFKIKEKEIMPWHYTDERYVYMPQDYVEKLDRIIAHKSVPSLLPEFFRSISLPVDDIASVSRINDPDMSSRSDYFIPMDVDDDFRIIASVKDNYQGLKVLMQLYAYASYYKNVDHDMPYLLKEPSEIPLVGVARFFTDFTLNFNWLNDWFGIAPSDSADYVRICCHAYRSNKLYETRRYLIYTLFEKELYNNPDQELGKLWWNLNEKILGINRPPKIHEYDWAIPTYFIRTPVLVQDYILAELIAAQISHKLKVDINMNGPASSLAENETYIGTFMRDRIFKFGNSIPWDKLIEKATGEPLSARYFYEQVTKNVKNENKMSYCRR